MFRSPSFWPLQIAGWSAYLVMVVATFLPVLGPDRSTWPLIELTRREHRADLHRLDLDRRRSGEVDGGLRLVLRRFASRVSFVQTALVVVSGAVAGGILWLTIMSVMFQPAARA